MNSLGFLCETPEILRDTMNVTINKIGNKRFGTPASKAVNVYALNLVKKWLLTPALHQPEDAEEPVLNLQRIRSLPLLEELIQWHPDGNFDRVSSLGMLMIYREDIYKILEYRKEEKEIGKAGDPFWFKQFQKNNSYMVDKIKRMKF